MSTFNRVRSDLKTTHPPLRIPGSTPRFIRYNTSFYDFFSPYKKKCSIVCASSKTFPANYLPVLTHGLFPLSTLRTESPSIFLGKIEAILLAGYPVSFLHFFLSIL